jgi:predicted PurR-regulated permease PerM
VAGGVDPTFEYIGETGLFVLSDILAAKHPGQVSRLPVTGNALTTVLLAVVVVVALYFGREVLVPIALAVLMSFVLAPPVRRLQAWYVPRILAVILVVLVAFSAIFSLGGLMVSQVNQLATDLPQYQSTLREKIRSLRGAAAGTGTLERASDVLQDLSKELDKPRGNMASPTPLAIDGSSSGKPILVEVKQPDPGALQTLALLISPLIYPLATTGIVAIFVIFILLQRQDLRNRLVRLAGSGDLQRTTAAMDDAGQRLSRLFLTQLALNAGFGLVIGAGLWFIGVPSAPLWGMLAMILRFVPYIGAVISAIFPLVLAAAVGPGWTMVLFTAALFPHCGTHRWPCGRASALRPQHRPFTCRGHCLGHVLDLALGTDRIGASHSVDNLSRCSRPPCRSVEIPRRHVWRSAVTDATGTGLSANASRRSGGSC